MSKNAALLISCLFAATSASAAGFWEPDPATVEKVDSEVAKLPNFKGVGCSAPPSITEFGRYYGGFTDAKGRRLIVGQLRLLKNISTAKPGIHIETAPIAIADGGCSIANVSFDADTLKLVSAYWGGR